MNDQDFQRLIHVLEEIRDNQREQFAMAQKQNERAERIQDRAERIQAKSSQLVDGSRKAMVAILPILTVLIIYVSWLIFHRPGH